MPNPFRGQPCPIEINLNIKGLEASGLGELKTLIKSLAAQLTQVKGLIMTTSAEFQAGFARVDTATTAIAERLRTLSEGLGGMTPAEEDAAKAQLDALATTLEAMGKSPDNPVPVEVPPAP